MGLDISFNKEEAVKAGLHLFLGEAPGTPERIAAAYAEGDPGYAVWLGEAPLCMDVPTMDYCVVYGEAWGKVFIRANKWGRTYTPITEWLKSHGIPWEES